ncbi:hypothetical protein ACFPOB_07625 [Bosea eneae]|uniref:Uncharacterized protein n=1 Tax=Bosea eneae TaxID=151454 RepID=A0ABW0IML7_9HYPH
MTESQMVLGTTPRADQSPPPAMSRVVMARSPPNLKSAVGLRARAHGPEPADQAHRLEGEQEGAAGEEGEVGNPRAARIEGPCLGLHGHALAEAAVFAEDAPGSIRLGL